VISLLTAALLERQIVIFCPDPARLSAVALSLLPLLRPLAWQSLLLPLTPAPMRGVLDAPVPFVAGVLYKTPELQAKCARAGAREGREGVQGRG
jgi:hypothetical protein